MGYQQLQQTSQLPLTRRRAVPLEAVRLQIPLQELRVTWAAAKSCDRPAANRLHRNHPPNSAQAVHARPGHVRLRKTSQADLQRPRTPMRARRLCRQQAVAAAHLLQWTLLRMHRSLLKRQPRNQRWQRVVQQMLILTDGWRSARPSASALRMTMPMSQPRRWRLPVRRHVVAAPLPGEQHRHNRPPHSLVGRSNVKISWSRRSSSRLSQLMAASVRVMLRRTRQGAAVLLRQMAPLVVQRAPASVLPHHSAGDATGTKHDHMWPLGCLTTWHRGMDGVMQEQCPPPPRAWHARCWPGAPPMFCAG